MELLKVFVGDGTASPASVAAMTKGDVLMLNASDYTPYTSGSGDIVIAVCTDKGVIYSTPIKKSNVAYVKYSGPSGATEKLAYAEVGSGDLVASGTYTLGVQIKEDLRMGTYNKNTEILSSYVVPASITSTTDKALKMDMASSFAKGFAANPLCSAGSPYQQFRAMRVFTSLPTDAADTEATFTLKAGSKQITWATGTDTLAAGVVAGVILNLGDSWYLVESVDSTNGIITLDTAYQGTNTSAVKNATEAITTAFFVPVASYPDTFKFKFQGIAQTQKNRYDQFRMVDFVVITPKGNENGLFTITDSAPVYPVGSYRQVRDLEEKAYTNSVPLINYREFPFEDFALNADSTKTYGILTITYTLGAGYNYMQSSSKDIPQTLVVAAPLVVDGLFDGTSSATTFADLVNSWWGTTVMTSNPT